ncbi:MAG: cytochrome P450 [Acidimicrobiales bacterium]
MASQPGRLDPLAFEDFDTAHADFAELRAGCPVARSEAFGGFHAVLGHAEVSEVLRQPRRYITSVQNVVPKVAFTGRRPPLHLDPPEHTPYRQALNPFFTEARVAAFAPVVERHVRELLAPYVAAGGGDLCREFTRRLPGHVFADLFHLSTEQSMQIKATSEVYNEALQNGDDDGVKQTSLELYDLARDIIEQRQRSPLDPADDITSALLAKRVDGEPLPPEMVLGTIRQMIVVGMIAPSVFIGAMAVHLARHPELQARLRADLDLVPAAVEEYLRLLTPYRGFARTSVDDTEIAGVPIPAGEPIALVYAAANRDPAVFPDPDEFVLDRPDIDRHLAFGFGPHRCAGEGLARELLRATLRALLDSTSSIEEAAPPTMTRWPEWGTLSAPLVVRAATSGESGKA